MSAFSGVMLNSSSQSPEDRVTVISTSERACAANLVRACSPTTVSWVEP